MIRGGNRWTVTSSRQNLFHRGNKNTWQCRLTEPTTFSRQKVPPNDDNNNEQKSCQAYCSLFQTLELRYFCSDHFICTQPWDSQPLPKWTRQNLAKKRTTLTSTVHLTPRHVSQNYLSQVWKTKFSLWDNFLPETRKLCGESPRFSTCIRGSVALAVHADAAELPQLCWPSWVTKGARCNSADSAQLAGTHVNIYRKACWVTTPLPWVTLGPKSKMTWPTCAK